MIRMSDAEKKSVWNDREKLKDWITLVAVMKNRAEKRERQFREQKEEAGKQLDLAEARMKIAESEMAEAEALGLELTRRLMESEEEK